MVITKCDICGCEISDDDPARKIRAEWDRPIDFLNEETNTWSVGHCEKCYDLCPRCRFRMFEFMEAFKEDPFITLVHPGENE